MDDYWTALRMGKGRVDPMIETAEICEFMGWDYYTYINQPTWFINLIKAKRTTEAKFKEWQLKKS